MMSNVLIALVCAVDEQRTDGEIAYRRWRRTMLTGPMRSLTAQPSDCVPAQSQVSTYPASDILCGMEIILQHLLDDWHPRPQHAFTSCRPIWAFLVCCLSVKAMKAACRVTHPILVVASRPSAAEVCAGLLLDTVACCACLGHCSRCLSFP